MILNFFQESLPVLMASSSIASFEPYMFGVWLSVFALACLIEMVTVKLIAVWFASAALLSLILSFIPGVPFWGEIIAFVLAVPLFFLLRPLIQKSIQKKSDKNKEA